MGPIVSIIISAYNAERYVEQTLDSVLKQSWQNLEIILVNDGSTDKTLTIAESFKSRGVKVLSQENKGQDAALNYGYKNSIGEYIKFMDSDDLINPEMIEKQIEVIKRETEYVAYGEWGRFFDNHMELTDFTPLSYWKDAAPLDFLTAEQSGVMLQCGIMLIPRKLIEKSGLWDERLILFNDTEFFTRILINSKGIKFSPGARLYYRSGMIGSISVGRARKFYESTFLATNLIAGHLLAVEDSVRIRELICNMFLMQHYHMYPKYPDLGEMHEERIAYFGNGSLQVDGGKAFKTLSKLLGWKMAKKFQMFFYDAGYLKLLYKVREYRSKYF